MEKPGGCLIEPFGTLSGIRDLGALTDFLQYQSKIRSDPVFRKRNVLPVQVPLIGRGEVLISEFHAVIESRGDGLHPMLKALLVRQAIEMTRLLDGMLQVGPGAASETSLQEKRYDPVVHLGQKLTRDANAPS
jgi:hypothetical protein